MFSIAYRALFLKKNRQDSKSRFAGSHRGTLCAPQNRHDRIVPADLAHIPLLLAKRNLVREELRGCFGSGFDSLEIAGTYNLLYNAAVMAEHGVGAVLRMEHDRSYENLRFIPLFPALETGTVLVWKKNQACSAAAAHFFAYI